MMINNMYHFLKRVFFVLVIIFFYCQSSFATGVVTDPTSASALGNSYAGSATGSHDLSDVFYNAANLGQVSGPTLVFSGGYVKNVIDTDHVHSGKISDPEANNQSSDAGSDYLIPAVYFATPISKKWQAGIALTSPFSLRTGYDSNWGGKYYSLDSTIKTNNLDTILSYKINDDLDFAFGAQFQHIDILFNKKVNKGSNPDSLMQTKGDNTKIGYLLGLKYRLNNQLKIGIGYRSRINHKVTGDFSLTNAIDPAPMEVKFTMPEILNFGFAYQFDPKLEIVFDSFFTRWSVMDDFTVKINNPVITGVSVPMNWKNSQMFSLGTNYRFNSKWLLRNGVAYEQSAVQNKLVNPRVPPGDRYWLSIGTSYQINHSTSVDFSYGHLFFKAVNSYDQANGSLPSLSAKYKTRVDLLGFGLSCKF